MRSRLYLFEEAETGIGISVLSLLEAQGILKKVRSEAEFEHTLAQYRQLFDRILHVDESLVLHAILLPQSATTRLPGIGSLIAATAALQGAILVHRDAHFLAIPQDKLKQEMLVPEG